MKLLLLSDATMCADGGGISQTLYNIFSFSDPRSILCITDLKVFNKHYPTRPFDSCYHTYNFNIITLSANRFSRYFNRYIEWFNYSFNHLFRSFKKLRQQIKFFDPDIIISCSCSPVGVFMHYKLLKGINNKRVIPYYMDDWMEDVKLSWIGGSVYNNVQRMLTGNSVWLTISKNLTNILAEKYSAVPEKVLTIHNPVDITDLPDVKPLPEKQKYSLAYAGALWDMHYDAFKLIAQSIFKLQKEQRIELVLYTSTEFWNYRKNELIPLRVCYGGAIPYKEIHTKLALADALLLVSSFSKKWINHSKGSLQTKVTDYLKAQRLIISCGPAYSVNHEFLKQNACGICIETKDVKQVSNNIEKIFKNLSSYQYLVENGLNALESFSKDLVQEKLIKFLMSVGESYNKPVSSTQTKFDFT